MKDTLSLAAVSVAGVVSLLVKETLDRIQSIAAQDITRRATELNILVVLKDFKGWKRGPDWGDMTFFERYQQNIVKIAVVGDAKWKTETEMFLAAGHRSGAVRFSTPEQEPQARAWLAERP
jgi:hypothetical protein